MERLCPICEKMFIAENRKHKGKFCSKECASIARRKNDLLYNKEWLADVANNFTQYEIAEMLGVAQQTVCKRMKFYNIICTDKRRVILEELNEPWLRQKYEIEKMTMPAIAKYLDTSEKVVRTRLKSFGIKSRKSGPPIQAPPENRQMSKALRSRINQAIRKNLPDDFKGRIIRSSTAELLGCSLLDLKLHLSSNFQRGMTWENYGRGGWEIDHIIPCARFDLSSPEEQKRCFHYSNLQPLWAEDNRRKYTK